MIDVCDYVDYRGKTPTKTDSGVFLVTAKNVKEGYIDYGASQEYISEDDYEEVMRRGKPEIGDVLITTEAPCGNVAQVNKADIALAQRIIKYRGQSNVVDNTYLKYYLLSPEFQNILNAKSSGGTVKGIKGSILHQQGIKYPKYEEQFKIGSYFNNLDHLITLHQREHDQLKELKKTMLKKMFPRDGSNIPEVRFAGFTDDWEQRKVGDYYDFKNGLNKGKEFFGSGTPIVNFTDVFHNRGIYPESLRGKVTLDVAEIKNYEVKQGDIFFTRTSETIEEIGYPSVMLGKPENTVFSGFVLRGRTILKEDPLDNLFKKYVFFTDVFRKEMVKKSSMTTRALTSGTALKNMEFLHPVRIEEQKKIGEYFSNLDNLITLHQRELEILKNLKKTCLKRMFI